MKTLELTSKTGKVIRFEAEYICKLADRIVDADGDRVTVGTETTTVGSILTVYVDGAKVDSCWNPNFWGLIDLREHPGVRKIWGLKIAFTDPAQAAEYEAWINSVIDEGTDEEVKAMATEQAKEEKAKEIAYLEDVIRRAEAQEDIPSAAEAAERRKVYNDLHNEGGEGFVPCIISRERYDAAKERLAQLANDCGVE